MSITAAAPPASVRGRSARRRAAPLVGVLPFFGYTAVFLLLPTLIVIVGAFQDRAGAFTTSNLAAFGNEQVVNAFVRSILLSAITAIIGAVVGGVLAYAISTAPPRSFLRKIVTAACSVLAQFGGVMLAFAFIATVGATGSLTRLLKDWLGVESTGQWLYDFSGLALVYTYFQIPLMVLVFLPAVEGLRVQWREAAESLGASTFVYWRKIAGPILAPSFVGCTLLLFANAFSAYATAAALITQYNTLVPLQIRGALTSEVDLTQQGLAKVLALGMVVVVAVVMTIYAYLGKRTNKWLA